jgi:hypothetical protein
VARLEDLTHGTSVSGILPDAFVIVVNIQLFGSDAPELTYKDPAGRVANRLPYRHDEPPFKIVEEGRPWGFDGEGSLFRLVSQAHRIRLAHMFDPVLAVHTSLVEPLPHQITAVYEAMPPRRRLGSKVEVAQDLGYRLYSLSQRKKRAVDAQRPGTELAGDSPPDRGTPSAPTSAKKE